MHRGRQRPVEPKRSSRWEAEAAASRGVIRSTCSDRQVSRWSGPPPQRTVSDRYRRPPTFVSQNRMTAASLERVLRCERRPVTVRCQDRPVAKAFRRARSAQGPTGEPACQVIKCPPVATLRWTCSQSGSWARTPTVILILCAESPGTRWAHDRHKAKRRPQGRRSTILMSLRQIVGLL
jgi:hypothetical protein